MVNLRFHFVVSIFGIVGLASVSSASVGNARKLIEKSLNALGGEAALGNVTGVIYETPKIYRSQSLMQSYNMLTADVYIAIDGTQNMSFAFTSEHLQQRIDRQFTRSEYWYFANPTLDPIEFSLVVQDGKKSFASYVHGNNFVFAPRTETPGYQDNGLVEYLTHQANTMSPRLLSRVALNKAYSSSLVELQPGVFLPAVHDSVLNLTILFDPKTHLPYIVRTYENSYVYGPSTRDLQLSKYGEVDGIMFPHRFMTIYNNDSVIEDVLVHTIKVNPTFPPDFFNGDPEGHTIPPKPTYVDPKEYPQSEIGEFYDNMLWDGVYTGTYAAIKASHPLPGLPQLTHLVFPDAPNYENLVLEFDDGVMVLDAPPHQSKLIIKWVQRNIGKPITHIWTTHHHHDHSGGTPDFTSLGATLIIPTVAEPYWRRSTPNATLTTYNATHPYIHADATLQARFLWEHQAVHALDWSYAIVTARCPGPGDGIVAFEADAWSPGTDATRFDVNFARQWLRQAERDGLSRDAVVVPVHGGNRAGGSPLRDLIDVTGYKYPEFDTRSWKAGGGICLM